MPSGAVASVLENAGKKKTTLRSRIVQYGRTMEHCGRNRFSWETGNKAAALRPDPIHGHDATLPDFIVPSDNARMFGFRERNGERIAKRNGIPHFDTGRRHDSL